MKKLVTFLILIAAAGGAAFYYFKYGKTVEKPQVIQATISRGDIIEVVSATGTLEPMRRVDVGSQVSGVVQELFVDFNSIVTKGMVLAKIDPSLLQVQVEIQEANIERQQMEIENQKVQLEDLQMQLARTQALFDKQLQNQQQLDAARLAVKNRMSQIESAKKQMVQSEANLRQAKLNVSYTTIVSPIDGVVVERRVDRGQTVQASMTTPNFFVLATDLRTLRLSAGIDEADIGRVEVGQKVMFRVDAYGGQEFEGTVDTVRLNASNQNNVVTYPVWIRVPNPELKLRPAMTAQLRVIIQTAPNVVRVPNAALRFRPNNDIYAALGLEPPAAGRGRSLAAEINGDVNGGGRAGGAPGAGRQGGGQQQGSPQPQQGAQPSGGSQQQGAQPGGAQGSGQGGNRQPGQAGQNRQGGRGFGGQSGMANLTPEQIQQFREKFRQSGGGRGGGGRGGQTGEGGRGGQAGRPTPAGQNATAPPVELKADKIDELFAPVSRPEQRASVYTWNPTKNPPELKQVNVRLGVTDGTFSELLSGDVQVDQQVVTGVILPQAQRPNQPGQSIFGGPQRGPGGMTPGDRGGGGPGGGGGGGGRGGGGGGGRGGGN
jgi:HlyD family secretion protein